MSDLIAQLDGIMPTALTGSVAQTIGTTIAAAGFPAPVGAVAEVQRHSGPPLRAEVVGFRDDFTVLYPLQRCPRRAPRRPRPAGPHVALDPRGPRAARPSGRRRSTGDRRPAAAGAGRAHLARCAAHRSPARGRGSTEPLATGVRAIDGLLTCGKGQRMGVFSGSGVGKSVLLGMMARHTAADVIVLALIGERGREVNEFIERELGAAGLAKSVVVVATSNEPALVRTQAAMTATAVAEYFRDQGNDVLLLMDSLTRFALAQREIGLAAGEPAATRGFPPRFSPLLPRLVERAGRTAQGSITAFYAVLVEADDPNEPVSDAIRGLLDGHTWLSRKLGSRGHYPAIDVLESVSRLMTDVTDDEHRRAIYAVRGLMATYREHEDLISLGAYHRGGNKTVDAAIDMQDRTAPLPLPARRSAGLAGRTPESRWSGLQPAVLRASGRHTPGLTMSKFHFRLSTLLGLRQSARDECRLRLAEARRADAEFANQTAELRGPTGQHPGQRRRAAGPGRVRLASLAEADRYAAALRDRHADLRRRRETLADELERRRLALVEADREVKSLEKLCDRDQQRHQLEAARQEVWQ